MANKGPFSKLCITCDQEFLARHPKRKRCYDCSHCLICDEPVSGSKRRFCSNSCAGKWKYQNSPNVIKNLDAGRDHPNRAEGLRRYMTGRARHNMRGENNPNWNGGTYRDERHTEMGRVEYKTWRLTVLKRDNFSCILCGKGGRLEAHHIRPWRAHRDEWYDPSNGVTLCHGCHRSLRGREEELANRFTQHVINAQPVTLTQDEQERFLPFVCECHLCGATLTRPRWHRQKKLHFCNVAHRKEFERLIGGNWRGYLNGSLDTCINGHSRENYTGWKSNGQPYCKACDRERAVKRRAKQRTG